MADPSDVISIPALPDPPTLPDGQLPKTPQFPTLPEIPTAPTGSGTFLTVPAQSFTVCQHHTPHFRLRTPQIRIKVPAIPEFSAGKLPAGSTAAELVQMSSVLNSILEKLQRLQSQYDRVRAKLPQIAGQVQFRCPFNGRNPIHIER